MLVSPDDLESPEETLAVLSDPRALAEIREAREASARGDVASLESVRAELAARRSGG